MSDKEKLLAQIDELVQKSTFSLDALEAVNKLKKDLQSLADANEDLNDTLQVSKERSRTLEDQLKSYRTDLEIAQKRIVVLEENESKATKAIYEAEKYKEVSMTWEKAMNIVFKPNSVRETINKTVPVVVNSGGVEYVQSHPVSEFSTRDEC